jgi:hypothetical protein
MMKKQISREQRTTVIYGIFCIVLLLDVLQLWLLTGTMDAYLGGEEQVILPAAMVSLGCFLLNLGLLWYVYQIEKGKPNGRDSVNN